jgi:phytoene desaturase
MEKQRMKNILVLGAGIGGLSAAIHLAARGHRVTVLEKNPIVGGKMSEVRAEGFRFDTGPSVMTMKHVFEDLFRTAGRRMEDYLTFLPIDPLNRYFYPDGSRLDLSRDLSRTIEQIQRLEPRDAEGYLAYLAHAAKIHRITSPIFTYGPPPSASSFLKVSPLDMLAVDPFHTLQWDIERYVRHPKMRQLLGRFSTAALAVIAHVELTEGVWYPKGGIYEIARAYEKLARELGVDVRLNARVKEVKLDGKKITGILMEDGEFLPAGTVVSNIDVTTTYELMNSPIAEARRRKLYKQAPASSGQILLLGVEGNYSDLVHHNILFSSDYKKEFQQLFVENRLPDEPTVYICITSKSDPEHAPKGCENWFVMINAPALPLKGRSREEEEQEKAQATELLFNRLTAFGLDVRRKVRYQQLLNPRHFQQRTGAFRGSIYGISFNDRFAPFKRPRNRSEIQGLFFAGGSTHPGGGVPMVTLSGKLAAQLADQS